MLDRPFPTRERLRELFDYRDDGQLIWRPRDDVNGKPITRYVGTTAGSINSKGYSHTSVDGRIYDTHRLVFAWHNESPSGHIVDHINGEPLDNRIGNLRAATVAQNGTNRRKNDSATSKYYGVSWNTARGKWVAQSKRDGEVEYLGSFDDEREAAMARDARIRKFKDEFTRFNFPGELNRYDLHDYQNRTVDFIRENENCALWLDLGMGKTTSTLTALDDLFEQFAVGRALVIGPLRVVLNTWPKEVKKWAHLEHLTMCVIRGTPAQRVDILLNDTSDIHLINREMVRWLVETIRDHPELRKRFARKWPYDFVAIDEASGFKDHGSKRFRAIRKTLPHVQRMVELTGTPAGNGLLGLWAQMYLIDRGARLGKTFGEYRRNYFDSDYMGYSFVPKPGAEALIYEKLADIVMRLDADDYLEMPELLTHDIWIDFGSKVRAHYRELEREYLTAIEDTEIAVTHAAALTNKLLQCANGVAYTGQERETVHLHDAKIDALQTIVDTHPGRPVLVAYSYQPDRDRILEHFPGAVLLDDKPETEDRWNRGEIEMLIMHPACLLPATEALTETRGWTPIIDIRKGERVFDGVEFVPHRGCVYSGRRQVIDVFGIGMTPAHKLLIQNEWTEARLVGTSEDAKRAARYQYTGADPYIREMFAVRGHSGDVAPELPETQPSGVRAVPPLRRGCATPDVENAYIPHLAGHAAPGGRSKQQRLSTVRGARHRLASGMGSFRELLRGHARWVLGRTDVGAKRCERPVQPEELHLGVEPPAAKQQTEQSKTHLPGRGGTPSRTQSTDWFRQSDADGPSERGTVTRGRGPELPSFDIRDRQERNERPAPQTADVYDLVDCGPRNRFVIRNSAGDVFISHNSGGHGLNLQDGGNIVAWFGLNWSLELYQQFIARLHRQGQPESVVHLYRILAKDTADESVVASLEGNNTSQRALLDALRIDIRNRNP